MRGKYKRPLDPLFLSFKKVHVNLFLFQQKKSSTWSSDLETNETGNISFRPEKCGFKWKYHQPLPKPKTGTYADIINNIEIESPNSQSSYRLENHDFIEKYR